MRFVIEVPADDAQLISSLQALPGARMVQEDRLDGAELVRIILETAVATGGVAAIAQNAASAVKSGTTILASLGQLFSDSTKKYRADPNRRFAVYSGKRRLLSSDMSEQQVNERLRELDSADDRQT